MSKPEVWLRGPIDDIDPMLQPLAHALMQASEEVHAIMHDFNDEMLWEKPFGLASPGFHLQHLTGVLSRLFTYAAGAVLNEQQLLYLKSEGQPDTALSSAKLIEVFDLQVQQSIKQLQHANAQELSDKRFVGRARLPSTVIGLYVHAAEHTMRHIGQLLVTVKCLNN